MNYDYSFSTELSQLSSHIFIELCSSRELINIQLTYFQIGYDRRVRPNYGGAPVTVGVTLYVLDIGEVSEKFMDFTFDMYFRQFWRDERLRFQKKVGFYRWKSIRIVRMASEY